MDKRIFKEIMMKILNKNTFILIVLSTLVLSCDDILDENPDSSIGADQFWQTVGDAEIGVAAIYDGMQTTYSSKYFLWGEMRSDNFQLSGSANAEAVQLVENSLSDQNDEVSNWDDFYNMIHRANTAIEQIPNITGEVGPLLGEAHAIRAYAYFDAVRVWGSVPLYTEPVTGLDDDIFRPKTAGTTIMNDVVIPDMIRAEELIVTRISRSRFSLSSVYCLQAEVYMHVGEYALAKEALDKLESLGEFELVDDAPSFHELFRNEPEEDGEQGPELILSIVYNFDQDGGASGIYGLFWAGVPSYFISQSLEEKWQSTFPTDSVSWFTKYPDFVPTTVDEGDGSIIYGDYHRYVQLFEEDKEIGGRRYGKYNLTNYAPNTDDTDIVLYRYAGMLLLKAEAEVQLGNFEEAVTLVNRIRNARELPGITLADFQTKDELLDVILDERQFELIGEGKRWWDLIRNNKAVEVMAPINGQTASTLLFPIYFDHLVDNPNLSQTPGY
ncbi:MAG: RagB/SusD family nutrient uptake outer membrane protein [Bacteroidota bacterium]